MVGNVSGERLLIEAGPVANHAARGIRSPRITESAQGRRDRVIGVERPDDPEPDTDHAPNMACTRPARVRT